MRYDREITFLLAEGLKGPAKRIAAAELVCLLIHRQPTTEALDELDATIAKDADAEALTAFRELRQAIGLQ
jgi:hypothetical protein